MAKTAVIIGATSSLAYPLCTLLAEEGWNLVLSARDKKELSILRNDLIIRYNISAIAIHSDLAFVDFSAHEFVHKANSIYGNIDTLFVLAGDMEGNTGDIQKNIKNVTAVNFISPAAIIQEAAKLMESKRQGTIVVVSSVAGDRGRQSNFVYGSAKAALTAFCSGIRNKYSGSGVHIMTVKPGFLDTPMTYGMKSPLIYDRMDTAKIIIKAAKRKKDVIYVPFFWRFIMLIIIHIPEKIFKRLKL